MGWPVRKELADQWGADEVPTEEKAPTQEYAAQSSTTPPIPPPPTIPPVKKDRRNWWYVAYGVIGAGLFCLGHFVNGGYYGLFGWWVVGWAGVVLMVEEGRNGTPRYVESPRHDANMGR